MRRVHGLREGRHILDSAKKCDVSKHYKSTACDVIVTFNVDVTFDVKSYFNHVVPILESSITLLYFYVVRSQFVAVLG